MTDAGAPGTGFLPGTHIEIINPALERGRFRHALFDFDGTISLVRQGWQEVMTKLAVEEVMATPGGVDEDEVRAAVVEFITRLTGKETIFQMQRLADEVAARGGKALAAAEYKHEYYRRLHEKIDWRRRGLADGTVEPERFFVPGAREFLSALAGRGLTLYCASGTDYPYVMEEAGLLGVSAFFNGGIYGAMDGHAKHSKKVIIETVIRENGLHGSEFIAFGDGFVEIEDARAAGGAAVGVASDEVRREGVDQWKRSRLIEAGADIIVPDFREADALLAYLFARN